MVDFEKILNKNINHSMIIDREGVIKSMAECYNLGCERSAIKFDKLKNVFEYTLLHNVPESQRDVLRKDAGLIEGGI
jgi:hypothetical protein